MKKITPFLWFDGNALEAAKFYVSVFKNSKITGVMGPKDKPMTVSFRLDGTDFVALNGGPLYKFSEAVSFVVDCKDQKEINYYWSKLTKGGEESMCGWLKDKYGLSWQIVPSGLGKLLASPAAMQAMMKMQKLDIKALQQAGKR